MKKINLGCGPVGLDDWINLDWGILAIMHRFPLIEKLFYKMRFVPLDYKSKWPKNLKLCDCRKGLPFKPGSVDFIYTSHFLEHLKRFEAEHVLKECLRVLKTPGVLRIVLPDLKKISAKYMENDSDFFLKYAGRQERQRLGDLSAADLFCTMFYPEFYRVKAAGLAALATKFIRPHVWMYDFESLSRLLRDCGFKVIEEKKFKEGAVPDLDVLDLFPEASLYVEAKK